jgi:Tfp pilus assembly protein PilZ
VALDDDQTPDDRRRSPRAPVADLQVGLRFDSVQQFLSAYAGDISEGGMFVRMEKPQHKLGETVTLRFEAGKERIVQGTARIVRVDASGIGLQFVELDETSRKLVEMIVRIKLAAG